VWRQRQAQIASRPRIASASIDDPLANVRAGDPTTSATVEVTNAWRRRAHGQRRRRGGEQAAQRAARQGGRGGRRQGRDRTSPALGRGLGPGEAGLGQPHRGGPRQEPPRGDREEVAIHAQAQPPRSEGRIRALRAHFQPIATPADLVKLRARAVYYHTSFPSAPIRRPIGPRGETSVAPTLGGGYTARGPLRRGKVSPTAFLQAMESRS
jgi:hypothetical protein